MIKELTLRVTDLEKKAIAFCREKDVPFPIANYLVDFATEVTKELENENAELKKMYHESDEDNNKLRENIPLLAEAKELLTRFVMASVYFHGKEADLVEEAEQFLKNESQSKWVNPARTTNDNQIKLSEVRNGRI